MPCSGKNKLARGSKKAPRKFVPKVPEVSMVKKALVQGVPVSGYTIAQVMDAQMKSNVMATQARRRK